MAFGDVVDQFHDHNRLADTRAAERTYFAAFRKRADEIDNFDTGLKNLRLYILLGEGGRRPVDRITFSEFDRSLVIDRVACNIEDAPERPLAYRHTNGTTGI